MKSEQILKADILDIIFDNRNKSYGAYALRKYYPERIYKALGILFFFVAAFSVYFLLKKPAPVVKQDDIVIKMYSIPPATDKPKQKPPTPRPPVKSIQPPAASQLHVSTIRIVDSTEMATKLAKNLDSVAISDVTTDIPGNTKQIIKGPEGPLVPAGAGSSAAPTVDRITPVYTAEVMPSYPGGTEALIKFLQKNLHNPRDLEEGETVSVKILFVVGIDGSLKGFQTIEDGGAAFNNEVIRVLKKMPVWIPGKSAGENVSVYYTIPVKFVPQE